ncbi:MAG: hypothetical protein ACRD9R_11885 [Pyrinomonadaceae bacterium]
MIEREVGLRLWGLLAVLAAGVGLLLSGCASHPAEAAAAWGKIEPLKSRRADVERELGAPLRETPEAAASTLQFRVSGGTVVVAFVDAKFVATKKLSPELEGTVLQVVLKHEGSSATPESLSLVNNSGFEREDKDGVSVYRNLKDGLAYTFIGGKLRTTRYSPSAAQLAGAQEKR